MDSLLEIKKLLGLHEVRKISPTTIMVGVFNFHSGNIDTYPFQVHYIGKTPYGTSASATDYPNHVVNAYGIITYPSGSSYRHCEKLSYTDESQLSQLIEPLKEGVSGTYSSFFSELRHY